MFPAYNIKQNEDHVNEIKVVSEEKTLNWLTNASYQPEQEIEILKVEKKEKNEFILLSSKSEFSDSDSHDEKNKKKQKKKLKKKKQKRKKNERHEIFDKNFYVIRDPDYLRAFEGMTKELLLKAVFLEDIPNMTWKYAYRIDKHADRNNLCFDSNYFKVVPKYYVPFEDKDSEKSAKQKRKEQIEASRKYRYFRSIEQTKDVDIEKLNIKLFNSRLSKNLKLYLELKRNEEVAFVDVAGDFNKYFNEHPKDIDKWLEFIDYQDILASKRNFDQTKMTLYDRKISIFERALRENQNSFRLKFEFIKFKTQNYLLNELSSFEKVENEYLKLIEDELKQNNLKNIFQVWLEYLNSFINLNLANVTIGKIKQVFQTAVEFFLRNKSAFCKNEAQINEFYNIIYTFIATYARFLVSSGYDEKAIGLYQALIDFNTSTSKKYDLNSLKSLLELYYDSNLPKFSENHSIGWFEGLEKREELFEALDKTLFERYDDKIDEVEENILFNDVFTTRIEHKWLDIEYLRTIAHWYPYYVYVTAGESADDVADSDRLILFDSDINFALFNMQIDIKLQEKVDYYMIKLISNYLERFEVLSYSDETLVDLINSEDDLEYFYFLSEAFGFFDTISPVNCNFITRLISTKKEYLIDFFIQNQRNAFDQLVKRIDPIRIKTFVFIAKWKFELTLFQMASRFKLAAHSNQQIFLDNIKRDLSLNENRSNSQLWIEYAVLKYILFMCNTDSTNYIRSKEILSKELKKIFETLIRTNQTNQTNLLKICSTYLEIELEMYFRSHDVIFSDDFVEFGLGTLNLHQKDLVSNPDQTKIKFSESQKQYFIDFIIDCCLNKQTDVTKPKLQINATTRLLIAKKELSQKYEKFVNLVINKKENLNEAILYLKCYSFYLVLGKDYERLFEINQINSETNRLTNKFLIEKFMFFIQVLSYLHYRERVITKQEFKLKLFSILSYLIRNVHLVTEPLNRLIQLVLLKLRLSSMKLFSSQLIESNDLELMLNTYSVTRFKNKRLNSTTFLTIIFTELFKLEKILKQIQFNTVVEVNQQSIVPTLGFHNQIRKRFDEALKHLPKSFVLYLLVFQFEKKYLNESSSKINQFYYQALQNKPFCKVILNKSLE